MNATNTIGFWEKSTAIDAETYFVFYGDHDRGAGAGFMVRQGLAAAERTARLLSECGYKFTETRHAASIAELPNV